MMKLNVFKVTVAGLILIVSSIANATLVFSDLDIQSDSVTFTVNGDMTGYAAPGASGYILYNFNIRYVGDLWSGGTIRSPNTWSTSVFDSLTFSRLGNTGLFDAPIAYTWSEYDVTSLSGATATNRRVTLSFNENVLNVNATNGGVEFYWGWVNPASRGFTFLGSVPLVTTVAEPSTSVVFLLAMLCLVTVRLQSVFNLKRHSI